MQSLSPPLHLASAHLLLLCQRLVRASQFAKRKRIAKRLRSKRGKQLNRNSESPRLDHGQIPMKRKAKPLRITRTSTQWRLRKTNTPTQRRKKKNLAHPKDNRPWQLSMPSSHLSQIYEMLLLARKLPSGLRFLLLRCFGSFVMNGFNLAVILPM